MRKRSCFLMVLIFALLFGQLYSTKYAKTTMSKFINSSTDIVEGEVKSVECYWRTLDKKGINTKVVIEINNMIKGDLKGQVEITLHGGKIGEFGEEVDDTPELKIGDKGVFFLINHRGKYWIHSISLGYYEIQFDNSKGIKVVNNIYGTSVVENDINLSKVNNNVFQKKYDYTEFIQVVKNHVNNMEGK